MLLSLFQKRFTFICQGIAGVLFLGGLAGCSLQADLQNLFEESSQKTIQVTLSSSSPSTNNLNSIPVTVVLSEPVADFTANLLETTNASISNFSGSAKSYSFDLIPAGDGMVAIAFAETSLQSLKTNTSKPAEAASLVRTVDRLRPTVQLSSPFGSFSNMSTIPITVTFSEPIEDLEASDFVITGGGAAVLMLAGGGQIYDLIITTLFSDNISVTLPISKVKDFAGNEGFASNTLNITYDSQTPPGLNIAGPVPALGNSSTEFVWTLTYTGASAISLSSVTLIGTDHQDCVATISGSGSTTRTVKITGCTGNGTVGFGVPQGSAQDGLGNDAPADVSTYATVDNTAPIFTIGTANISEGNSSSTFEWLVTYVGADTISLDVNDVILSGTTIGCTKSVTTHDAMTRKIAVTGCSGDGFLTISIAAKSAQDSIGNQALSAGPSNVVTVDNMGPLLSISGVATYGSVLSNFTWSLSYTNADNIIIDDSFIILDGSESAIENCQKGIADTGGGTYSISITGCSGNGNFRLKIKKGSALDHLGNESLEKLSTTYAIVDNIRPTVTISKFWDPFDYGVGGASSVFEWKVKYSDSNISASYPGNHIFLDASYIIFEGDSEGCSAQVSQIDEAYSYVVRVTGCTTRSGQLSIKIAEGSAIDKAGHLSMESLPSSTVVISNPLLVSFKKDFDVVKTDMLAQEIEVVLNDVVASPVEVFYYITAYTTAGNPNDFDLLNGSVIVPAGDRSAKIHFAFSGSTSQIIQLAISEIKYSGGLSFAGDKNIFRRLVMDENSDLIEDVGVASYASCVLNKSGSVKCIGDNGFGHLGDGGVLRRSDSFVLISESNFNSISVGLYGVCGIKNTGDLWCWGNLLGVSSKMPTKFDVPSGSSKYSMVTVGGRHVCAVTDVNKLYCWGENIQGALGVGNVGNKTQPTFVGDDYAVVSAGGSTTCAIKVNGILYCWGDSTYGQTGTPRSGGRKYTPQQLGSDTYSIVSVGNSHTCAITVSKKLKCWGDNQDGQVGNGNIYNYDYHYSHSPYEVGSDYIAISAGYRSTCGIKQSGDLYCWGLEVYHNAANYNYKNVKIGTERAQPTFVSANVKKVTRGTYGNKCFISNDNGLFCWGEDSESSSGRVEHRKIKIPGKFSTLSVSRTGSSICGIKPDKKLYCWGDNSWGQLGNGASRQFRSFPIFIDDGYEKISVGDTFSCGIKDDKKIRCWGDGRRGQLANGRYGDPTPPQLTRELIIYPEEDKQYVEVSAGREHVCAIDIDSNLYCWGSDNSRGQTGVVSDGPVGSDYIKIATSRDSTCALKVGGELYCWGANDRGQLGLGDTLDRNQPERVGESLYSAVSMGDESICAKRTDGKILCWGFIRSMADGNASMLNSPTEMSGSYIEIVNSAGGAGHACGITSDNKLFCWGANHYSQIGLGTRNHLPELPQFIADGYKNIYLGHGITCAKDIDDEISCWGYNAFGQSGGGSLLGMPNPIIGY